MYWNPYCYKCLTNSTGENGKVQCNYIQLISGWAQTISLENFNEVDAQESDICDPKSILNADGVCIKKLCGLGYTIGSEDDDACRRNTEALLPLQPFTFNGGPEVTDFDICMVGQHSALVLYVLMNTSSITEYSNYNITNYLDEVFSNMASLWLPRYSNSSITVFKALWFPTKFNLTRFQNVVKNNANKITKAVLTADDAGKTTDIYGFDLDRLFEDPQRICSSLESIKPNDSINRNTCHEFGNTSIKYKLEISNAGQLTRTRLHCNAFHLHSSCFRQKIVYRNFTIFVSSENKEDPKIIITTLNYTTETYRAREYEPTADAGLQICVQLQNATYQQQRKRAKYVWQPAVDEASYVISMAGTILSIFSHIAFVLCFTRYNTLRNKGGMYILVLVIFLMISDILAIPTLSKNFHRNATACKWFGIMLYWALITVCGWSAVVAVDLGTRFATTLQHARDGNPMKTLHRRIAINMTFTTTIVIIVIALNETGTLVFDFETNCWIGKYQPLLTFYFVPILFVYIVCIAILIMVLWSLKQAQKRSKRVLKDTKLKDNALISIGIKLIVILGVTESIGLIQIRKMDLSESEAALNAAFGLFYNLTRSLRGVLIFIVYILNERTLKLIKAQHQTKCSLNTIPMSMSSNLTK